MNSTIEERAATILLRAPTRTVPVRRLYRQLAAELGPLPGGADQLERTLRSRPDRFLVIDPPRFIPSAETGGASHDAEDPLDAFSAAGLPTEPRVALVGPPPPESAHVDRSGAPADRDGGGDPAAMLVQRIHDALGELARAASDDPALGTELHEAAGQTQNLYDKVHARWLSARRRRSTTHPPHHGRPR